MMFGTKWELGTEGEFWVVYIWDACGSVTHRVGPKTLHQNIITDAVCEYMDRRSDPKRRSDRTPEHELSLCLTNAMQQR